MKRTLILLALVFIGCNQSQNEASSKNKATLAKTTSVGVYKPARCSRILRYTVTPYVNRWVEIMECVNVDGRWSVFFRGFGESYWYERFVY
ncbi:hypothetical protein D6817_00450 [Candidatus Pacearchaeota archaeon]|nr:MAG: hypothetical protein D6817_00450 [Candidatus Pacearchaeota archaeon]